MSTYLPASASVGLSWISAFLSKFVSVQWQQACYLRALGVYGVQRLAHLSVLHSASGNVKKLPSSVTIRCMRLMGVGEKMGSQGETLESVQE